MNPINWQQFGLKKNPYDTLPLAEGGDLELQKAFVGRRQERGILDSLFLSDNKICLAVCGDVGVGKTSLANYHKFLWKYGNKPKLLFSFRREIEANKDLLNKNNFLIEIIGSVLREIKLLDQNLLKNDLLKKISQIVDISQSMAISAGISAYGFGVDLSRETAIPIQFSSTMLEEYFLQLVDFIKHNEINRKKYSGLIIHVNNFDVVLSRERGREMAIDFFDEVRDVLQTADVYFLFLGPSNFFKNVVCARQRVKAIFSRTPIQILPLSKEEIIKAFDERMKLLTSDNVSDYIKPIEDKAICKIYDLYNGDIRSIMAGIMDILGQCSERLGKPLTTSEAMLLLGKERWEKIELMKLTTEQKEILKYLAKADKFISQKEIGQMFNKAQPNISGYYFKPLRENGIIEEKEKILRTPYYGLTEDYTPLKWLIKSQQEIKQSIKNESDQLNFDF